MSIFDEVRESQLRPIKSADRAKVYETVWRAYCATQSSDYAVNRGYEIGRQLGMSEFGVYEIAKDAIEKIQTLIRQYALSLLKETPERLDAYLRRFGDYKTNLYK